MGIMTCRGATGAGLLLAGALAITTTTTARAATPAQDAQLRQAWRATLAELAAHMSGCYTATYPDATWTPTPCGIAPAVPHIPRHGNASAGVSNTVGNGHDYAAGATSHTSSAVGSFPQITGLKTETGEGVSDAYSLQLNANFFTTTVCNGATTPAKCQGWQQFVYSSSGASRTGSAFMQYWLIDYGSKCPSGGWTSYEGDCYRNSASVDVPAQALTKLADLSVSGSAVANGTDTMMLTTPSKAYVTTGKDSVVELAAGWLASEYNVIGDGGGSEAKFNTGTSIIVAIALTDGLTTAPACEANAGTTGETNNLTLGSCEAFAGSTPSISFTESN